MINLETVSIYESNFDFTLNWDEPFANFDPIVNYTINISCTNDTGCPAMFNTPGNVTYLDVNLITNLSMMNHTISVAASNTVGTSNATTRIIAGKVLFTLHVRTYI